jgi:hypothetical protein
MRIVHPITNKRLSIYSKDGKTLLKFYIYFLQNGGAVETRIAVDEDACPVCGGDEVINQRLLQGADCDQLIMCAECIELQITDLLANGGDTNAETRGLLCGGGLYASCEDINTFLDGSEPAQRLIQYMTNKIQEQARGRQEEAEREAAEAEEDVDDPNMTQALKLIRETSILKCPNCNAWVADWDGCLAVNCGNQQCRHTFCGVCFVEHSTHGVEEERNVIHVHIPRCGHNILHCNVWGNGVPKLNSGQVREYYQKERKYVQFTAVMQTLYDEDLLLFARVLRKLQTLVPAYSTRIRNWWKRFPNDEYIDNYIRYVKQYRDHVKQALQLVPGPPSQFKIQMVNLKGKIQELTIDLWGKTATVTGGAAKKTSKAVVDGLRKLCGRRNCRVPDANLWPNLDDQRLRQLREDAELAQLLNARHVQEVADEEFAQNLDARFAQEEGGIEAAGAEERREQAERDAAAVEQQREQAAHDEELAQNLDARFAQNLADEELAQNLADEELAQNLANEELAQEEEGIDELRDEEDEDEDELGRPQKRRAAHQSSDEDPYYIPQRSMAEEMAIQARRQERIQGIPKRLRRGR